MAKSGFSITRGLPALKKFFEQSPKNALAGLESGAREWGERTIAVSKAGGEGYTGNIVPVDTGVLMSSGHVGEVSVSGTKMRVVIGYGGPASRYAAAVHEIPKRYRRPGSGTDYLRGPAVHMGRKVGEIVGPHVKNALEGKA